VQCVPKGFVNILSLIVVGENDIILEVNDNLGPEMIVDLSEWVRQPVITQTFRIYNTELLTDCWSSIQQAY